MRSRIAPGIVVVGLLGGLAPALAVDEANRLDVRLENADGKCLFAVDGKAPHLPNGTFLHVSLIVLNVEPPIEAAFFRVVVQNGAYSGTQEWPDRSFAPDRYQTRVRLHMDVQPPGVKTALQHEFGYMNDHVEEIATQESSVGTPEEQAAHLKSTLVTLRDLCVRLEGFRARLAARVVQPKAADAGWADFATAFSTELDACMADYDHIFAARLAWRQAAMFEQLGGSLRDLYRFRDLHAKGNPSVARRLEAMGQDVGRLKANIESRLPREPEAPPGRPGPR